MPVRVSTWPLSFGSRNWLTYADAVDMFSFGVIAAKVLTRWVANLDGWDPDLPPSKAQHEKWTDKMLHSCVALAPERFRSFLRGLLSEIPENRWTSGIQEGRGLGVSSG